MIPHDRRSSPRVETGHLVIHSELPAQGQCLGMAVSLDLNEFGLRVQTSQKFAIGERFRFSIALKEEIVSATGRVVHCEQALNGTWEVGIEFLQIAAEDIERVRQFMKARV